MRCCRAMAIYAAATQGKPGNALSPTAECGGHAPFRHQDELITTLNVAAIDYRAGPSGAVYGGCRHNGCTRAAQASQRLLSSNAGGQEQVSKSKCSKYIQLMIQKSQVSTASPPVAASSQRSHPPAPPPPGACAQRSLRPYSACPPRLCPAQGAAPPQYHP